MKTSPFLALTLVAGLWLAAGCSYIEIKPEGNPDRVLTGTVNFGATDPLPPGSSVSVRVLDTSDPVAGPVVLGEQKIPNPGTPPVPFRIEYRAEDTVLRHGLNIEARISVGGKLRFYNVNSYAVTLANAAEPHEVWVNPAGRE